MVRHYRSFLYAGISLVGIRGRFVVSDHLQARTPFLSLFLTFAFFTLILRTERHSLLYITISYTGIMFVLSIKGMPWVWAAFLAVDAAFCVAFLAFAFALAAAAAAFLFALLN